MISINNRLKKHQLFLIIPLIVIFFSVVIAKKIIQYSSAPSTWKDCLTGTTNSSDKNTLKIPEIKSSINFAQKSGTINDASCLNKTTVFGVVKVNNIDDIKSAITFAKNNKLKISAAGARHSMGGQSFADNAVVLDMTSFREMSLNEKTRILTVQSGASWSDIQNFLNQKNFAVKVMQATNVFTVGGSISVNAHGMDHNAGSIANTVKSLKLMDDSGNILTVSKSENPELFKSVIGGYGLFGVIIEADLDVTQNEVYKRSVELIDYQDFPEKFRSQIQADNSYKLFTAHMSTDPKTFLKEMILYKYQSVDSNTNKTFELKKETGVAFKRLMFNLTKKAPMGGKIRWLTEKHLEPNFRDCNVSRSEIMANEEACYVSRNESMHESGMYLRNNLKNNTDILQEYFIPRDKFVPFIDEIRPVLIESGLNIMNVGVRVVNKEDISLNYAPQDMFAIVLYINQKVSHQDNEKMAKLTQDLINLTNKHGGTFYLPYQLSYTKDELIRAYPNVDNFFKLKTKYDPNNLYRNKFYEKYSI